MEGAKEIDIYLLLFAGTFLLLLLSAGIIFFISMYRRKLERQQKSIVYMRQKLQQELLQSNIKILEAERKRFAADLHDGVGGKLSALRLHMSRMERNQHDPILVHSMASESKEVIDIIIETTRRIAHNTMPPDFEFTDLFTAVEELADWVNGSSQIVVHTDCSELSAMKNRMAELSVFRIIQELLSNTIRHASATSVSINIYMHHRTMLIDYMDDGCGMDLSTIKFRKGLGLKNIDDRVALLKGNIHYLNTRSKGFACHVELPV